MLDLDNPVARPLSRAEEIDLYGDPQEDAYAAERLRDQALTDADGLADWLYSECAHKRPYLHGALSVCSAVAQHERALRQDYLNARMLATDELMALGLGLSLDKAVRCIAMDEIARRFAKDHYQGVAL